MLAESHDKIDSLISAGQFQEVEVILKRRLAENPNNAETWYFFGLSALRQKNYRAAIPPFLRSLEIAPASPILHAYLGLAYKFSGQIKPAVRALKNARKLGMENATVLINLAEALHGLGALEEAQSIYDEVHKGGNAEAGWRSVSIVAAAGRYAEAIDRMKAIEGELSDPTFAKYAADLYKDTLLLKQLAAHLSYRSKELNFAQPSSTLEYSSLIKANLNIYADVELIVVFFHAAVAGKHAIDNYHIGKRADYIGLLSIASARVKQVIPRSKVILLTDRDTVFPSLPMVDSIIRLPIRREWIMYERMRAQRAFAASDRMTENVLFIDTDILLNENFPSVFKDSFDVGLTWRSHFLVTPINGGMIMGRKGRERQVVEFFDRCLMSYEEMASLSYVQERYGFDIREFQGDQLALASFIGWQSPPGWPEEQTVNGVKVRILPCEDVNFSFMPEYSFGLLDLKLAVHFKGAIAKDYARAYANDAKASTGSYFGPV